MRRVKEKVSIEEAKRRLHDFGLERDRAGRLNRNQLWRPGTLADVIWPDNSFLSQQGAARAATAILHKITEIRWSYRKSENGLFDTSGWDLSGLRVMDAK